MCITTTKQQKRQTSSACTAHERACLGLVDSLDGIQDHLAEHGDHCGCDVCDGMRGMLWTLRRQRDCLASMTKSPLVLDRWLGRLPA